MLDRKVLIVFRGGAQQEFEATQAEWKIILDQWLKHVADPDQQPMIIASYADGKGDLRHLGSEIAGISSKLN